MKLDVQRVELRKRVPLTLSRETVVGSTNVVVTVEHDGVTGCGEAAPNAVTGDTTDEIERAVAAASPCLANLRPDELQRIERVRTLMSSPAARAAIDVACHDWIGRLRGLPLWQYLGLDPQAWPATSITVGIGEPAWIAERVADICATWSPTAVKVKLGCASGLGADLDAVGAARGAAGAGVELWVDVNGGWDAATARAAMPELAAAGVVVIEQPLARHAIGDLRWLRDSSGEMRLHLDESVHDAADVVRVAGLCDGVNIKLMKCGGIGDAVRAVHVARAAGLDVMLGCMGESSLGITGAAHLAPLADRVDLDSNLNLVSDPFRGATWDRGRLVLPVTPGIGVERA